MYVLWIQVTRRRSRHCSLATWASQQIVVILIIVRRCSLQIPHRLGIHIFEIYIHLWKIARTLLW